MHRMTMPAPFQESCQARKARGSSLRRRGDAHQPRENRSGRNVCALPAAHAGMQLAVGRFVLDDTEPHGVGGDAKAFEAACRPRSEVAGEVPA